MSCPNPVHCGTTCFCVLVSWVLNPQSRRRPSGKARCYAPKTWPPVHKHLTEFSLQLIQLSLKDMLTYVSQAKAAPDSRFCDTYDKPRHTTLILWHDAQMSVSQRKEAKVHLLGNGSVQAFTGLRSQQWELRCLVAVNHRGEPVVKFWAWI
jgi:hypothetical protein